MTSKIRLEPVEAMQAAFIAVSMSQQALAFMKINDIPLDITIQALAVTIGGFLAQREQVEVESTSDVTQEMLDACIDIMRRNAINTNTPKPSNN